MVQQHRASNERASRYVERSGEPGWDGPREMSESSTLKISRGPRGSAHVPEAPARAPGLGQPVHDGSASVDGARARRFEGSALRRGPPERRWARWPARRGRPLRRRKHGVRLTGIAKETLSIPARGRHFDAARRTVEFSGEQGRAASATLLEGELSAASDRAVLAVPQAHPR